MYRFMMRLTIGYPTRDREIQMAQGFLNGQTPDTVEAVCTPADILELQKEVQNIKVNDLVLGYIEDLMDLTRKEERFVLGASPRAMLALIRGAQARAFLQGRDFVKPDDVKMMAEVILLHRLVLTSDARIRKENPAAILKSLVVKAKIPV